MTLVLNPADEISIQADLTKDQTRFSKDPKKFLAMAKVRSGKKNVTFEASGEICTAGISCTDFGTDKKKKPSYSVGLLIENETEFERLHKMLEDYCYSTFKENWEVSEPVKDEKLYIKLKLDGSGKKFAFKSNLSLTPKKFSDAANATNLHVEGEVQTWFNFADKKAGLIFSPKYLTFDEDEDNEEAEQDEQEEEDETPPKPPAKKRKTSPPTV